MQVSNVFKDSPFKVFADTLASGGIIKALRVPSAGKSYSNTALKKGDLYTEALKSGAKGLPFLKVNDGKNRYSQKLYLLQIMWREMLWSCG